MRSRNEKAPQSSVRGVLPKKAREANVLSRSKCLRTGPQGARPLLAIFKRNALPLTDKTLD
jgi:hypothetical protein